MISHILHHDNLLKSNIKDNTGIKRLRNEYILQIIKGLNREIKNLNFDRNA